MNPFFKQINTIFYALLAGQLLFCGVAVFLRYQGDGILDESSSYNDTLTVISPFLALAAFSGAWYIQKMRASQGSSLTTLNEKMQHYRATVIIRSAMIEGANLFLLISYFLSGRPMLLFWFGAGIVFFILFRPSVAGFTQEYTLSPQEEAALNKAS